MENNNSDSAPPLRKPAPIVTSESDLLNAGFATAAFVGLGAVVLRRSNLLPGILLGVGAMMAPRIFPDLEPALRPLIKSVLRAGYTAAGRAKEVVAEAGEQFQDMIAEIRYEDDVVQAKDEEGG
jgi:hypothetical protein